MEEVAEAVGLGVVDIGGTRASLASLDVDKEKGNRGTDAGDVGGAEARAEPGQRGRHIRRGSVLRD